MGENWPQSLGFQKVGMTVLEPGFFLGGGNVDVGNVRIRSLAHSLVVCRFS